MKAILIATLLFTTVIIAAQAADDKKSDYLRGFFEGVQNQPNIKGFD